MDPSEFSSPMTESCIGLHTLFTSLVEGGFTEDQALTIVARIITTNGDDD